MLRDIELVDPVGVDKASVAEVWSSPMPTFKPVEGLNVVRAPYAVWSLTRTDSPKNPLMVVVRPPKTVKRATPRVAETWAPRSPVSGL